MTDFEKDIDPVLLAKYRAMTDDELDAAYLAPASQEEKTAMFAERLYRRRKARQKIPEKERRKNAYDRFVLHKDDIITQ